jgi:integrase/recombinase XerC
MNLNNLPVLAQQFLEQLLTQRYLSSLTQLRYAQALSTLHEINQDLTVITSAQMQRVISQRHASGISPRSLAVMVSVWRTYGRWALKQKKILFDVSGSLLLPKQQHRLPKALSTDLMQLYLRRQPSESLDNEKQQRLNVRDQAVLELLYGCGLRASELLGIDCIKTTSSEGWLDTASKVVRVLGKGKKPRSIPLPSMALTAIEQWMCVREQCLRNNQTENALFLGVRGGRLSGTELRRMTQKRALFAQTGQSVHPHVLRHSYASHLLQSSADLRGVQELLGHESIRATQIYTKLDFQHLSKIYDKAHPRATLKK